MYARKFQQFVRVPLLVVDDFALESLLAPHDEDFHDFVAALYERAATLLTSNLDLRKWRNAFPDNCVLGAATLDCLRHGCYSSIQSFVFTPKT
jgi:DNA replication protein DnaC